MSDRKVCAVSLSRTEAVKLKFFPKVLFYREISELKKNEKDRNNGIVISFFMINIFVSAKENLQWIMMSGSRKFKQMIFM